MQHVDRPADVQAFSQPARHRRSRVQVKPLRVMLRSQRVDGIAGHRRRRLNFRHEPAVRAPEASLPVRLASIS